MSESMLRVPYLCYALEVLEGARFCINIADNKLTRLPPTFQVQDLQLRVQHYW